MGKMPHPFKVKLSDKTAKLLGELANQLKGDDCGYQIGVGTIAGKVLDKIVASRPELLQQLLEIESDDDQDSRPKGKSGRRAA